MASPGLNEITTTTARNRTMKGEAAKSLKEVQKSGTHVPEKDFNSKKKESLAAKGGPKGSLTGGKSEKDGKTPEKGRRAFEITAIAHEEPKGYDGSMKDWSDDHRQARSKGMSAQEWENSAADRLADSVGEKTLREDDKDKIHHAPEYKKGVGAFGNSPKTAHGYGHPPSARHGHLRCSGSPGAHQIGCKKR